jgi:hypothetical protein
MLRTDRPRHHLACGEAKPNSLICSGGFISYPATIMTRDCRGEARGAKPKRPVSYRGIDICIISTAQQAKPNVIHIKEPVRVHAIKSSAAETKKPFVGQLLADLHEKWNVGMCGSAAVLQV